MNSKMLILFLLATLLLGQDSFGKATLTIGETVNGEMTQENGYQSFLQLEVRDVKPNAYLFFLVTLPIQNQWEVINLSIFNDLKSQPLMKCSNDAIDGCFLPASSLKQIMQLTIKIECQGSCKYYFNTYWNQVKEIKDNIKAQVKFSEMGNALLYKINGQNNQYNQLHIIVIPKSESILDRVKIFANLNNQIPTFTDHRFTSVNLWNGGQGLFLDKSMILNNNITLMIVGESNSIYTLKYQVINSQYHAIGTNQAYHDYASLDKTKKLKINLDLSTNAQIDNLYVIELNIHTGQMMIGFYMDDLFRNQFQMKPFQFRGSSKYIFSSRILKQSNITQIYAGIQAMVSPATFTIKVQRQFMSSAGQLQDGIYSFLSIRSKQLAYLKFRNWNVNPEAIPNKLIIAELALKNGITPIFRICNKGLIECTSLKTYQSSSTLIAAEKTQQVGSQLVYTIKIDPIAYYNLTNDGKEGILIMQLNPSQQKQNSFLAFYYTDDNRIESLPDGRFTEGRIQLGMKKYYYYQNKNHIVTSIVFRLTVTNGKVLLSYARKDPRSDNNVNIQPLTDNFARITENLLDPIIIILTGVTESAYALNVQISVGNSPNNYMNSIKLLQDKDQTFNIKPNGAYLLQIVTTEKEIQFTFDSTGQVGACQVAQPFDKCSENLPIIGNKDTVNLIKGQKGQTFVRIMNINSQKAVQTTVSYHSGLLQHCKKKQIGRVYNDILEDGVCLTYALDKIQDIEALFFRPEIAQMKVYPYICQKLIEIKSVRFTITKETIQEKCKGISGLQRFTVMLQPFRSNETTMKVQYSVQYSSNALYLSDGIAHSQQLNSHEGILKKYYYKMINKESTQILIHSKIGKVIAFIKIVEEGQQAHTSISNSDFDLKSSENILFKSDISISLDDELVKSKQCRSCLLIIIVEALTFHDGLEISYNIEVTQNNILLNDHQQRFSFLPQGSTSYYQYQCKQKGMQIIFEVSDNHQKCTRIYASKRQYPSQQNMIDSSIDGELTLQCKQSMYYFGVQAIKDCPSSVTAQSTDFKLTKITSGTPVQFSLNENQISYFTFVHSTKQPFKIVSLEKFGNVQMHLNEATTQIMDTVIQGNVDLGKFAIVNTYQNQIEVKPNMKGFCDRCLYLLAVKAESKIVDSILFLAQNGQPVLMAPQKVIYDELDPKENTVLDYLNILKGTIFINVFSGTVNLAIAYGTHLMNWKIQQSQQTNKFDYNFIDPNLNYDWKFIKINIQNIGDKKVTYSLHISRDDNPQLNALIVKQGIPAYIQIQKGDTFCLKGFFIKMLQKIYYTVKNKNKADLYRLVVNLTVNNNPEKIVPKIIQNNLEISYQIKDNQQDQTPYSLCLTNKADRLLKLHFIQSAKTNLLATNTWSIVSTQQIYMINAQDKFFIDAFVCKGDLSYTFTQSYQEIMGNTSQIFSINTKQQEMELNKKQLNHVILHQPSKFATTYARFYTNQARIQWLSFNQKQQKGIGYIKYQSGDISYDSLTNTLAIMWDPIRSFRPTNTSINSIKFRLFISDTLDRVKSAAGCEMFGFKNFFMKEVIINKDQYTNEYIPQGKQAQLIIDKSQIKSKFQQGNSQNHNLYIMVSAEVKLLVPTVKQQEEYRFLYNPIAMPKILLNEGTTSEGYTSNVSILLGTVALLILSLGCFCYLFAKKIIPLISRLRMRMMLEQEVRNGESAPSIQEQGQTEKKIGIDDDV